MPSKLWTASLALSLGLMLAAAAQARPCASAPPDGVRVTYLGVSSLLFDDGADQLLVDGYFSRPHWSRWLVSLRPDPARINAVMDKIGACRVRAVLVAHAHHDHVLDAPDIAKSENALLVGGTSVATVARGPGRHLPARQIRQLDPGEALVCGRYRVTAFVTPHAKGLLSLEEPKASIKRTSWLFAYGAGQNLAYFIEHESGASALVIPSASKDFAAPETVRPHTVFLGVGLLGYRPDPEIQQYWDRAIVDTGAEEVVAVHWDDFSAPLSGKLPFAPLLIDNPRHTLEVMSARAKTPFDRMEGYESRQLKPIPNRAASWSATAREGRAAGSHCRLLPA
jgi:L-ascorbate metabolism protein UlaG (beta-lactamase superfamily)